MFRPVGPDATQNEACKVVQRQPCISTGRHATGGIVEGGGDVMSAIGKQAKKQSWELKPGWAGEEGRGGRKGIMIRGEEKCKIKRNSDNNAVD